MTTDLLEQAQKKGTPLVEGERATFLWEGKHPPRLIGDFNEWEEELALPFHEVGPQLWAVDLTLPPDGYMEYALVRDGDRVLDPLNPNSIPNGFGRRNHYFYMPEGKPTPLVKRQKRVPHGEVQKVNLPTAEMVTGHTRPVYFYSPPAPGPFPLLVVWDGEDYLRRAWLARILDNLIAQGRISPVAMALIDTTTPSRIPELGCSEGTLAFLLDIVIPKALEHLDLISYKEQPGCWGLLGASLGGLMSLFTALRLPQMFGKVLSQSGAFSQLVEDAVIFDLAAVKPKYPLDIWMETGIWESLIPENRRMRDLLQERGHRVTYREFPGGHNYTSWRNEVWRGLETLFPVNP